jgi:hypothetical protein
MNGGEAKFWRNELKNAFNAMGDVDRIESHSTSIGRPDVNICLDPGIIWDIELKYSDNGKVRVRPAQRMWFAKRMRVKANVAFLTKAVINGRSVYFMNMYPPNENFLDDWINRAHVVWDDKIDFNELEEILRAQK